ncbi:MAG TPA: hypothetical protein DEA22_01460 [Blastocatellia bacterium]|nr:hypothetical protein [Blastocatellia bacterium]
MEMKKITFAILAITLLGIGAILAFAQGAADKPEFGRFGKFNRGGSHKMGRGGFGMFFKGLNLTDEQKASLKQMMDEGRAKMEPIHAALRENREKMQAATANGAFDEVQVTALANEQAGLMAKMIVERERAKASAFAILTDEQKAKAAEMKQKMEERFKNRGMRRGGEGPGTGFLK